MSILACGPAVEKSQNDKKPYLCKRALILSESNKIPVTFEAAVNDAILILESYWYLYNLRSKWSKSMLDVLLYLA